MKIILLLVALGVYGCAEYSPPDNFSCSGESFPAKWDDGVQIYKIVDGDMVMSLRTHGGAKQEIVFKLTRDGFDYYLTPKDNAGDREHKINGANEAIIKLVKLADDVNDHDFIYHKYAMSFAQGTETREGYCLGYKS